MYVIQFQLLFFGKPIFQQTVGNKTGQSIMEYLFIT